MDEISPNDPDVTLGGLRIWIHGYQYESTPDYWDGNWLQLTAQCTGKSSSVRVHGPFLRSDELARFLGGCRQLCDTAKGVAELSCMEPYLAAKIAATDRRGSLEVEVRITPDNLNQHHVFRFELDQSYVPDLIRSLERLLDRFPIRGGQGGQTRA